MLWNPDYLLGQVIRQYHISDDKYYISQKANALWRKITKQNIWNYSYQDKIFCENDEELIAKSYKGASSKYFAVTLKSGAYFTFNDIFHDEHIIPINVIIKDLKALPEYTYKNVEDTLDKIRVCRMLKEENREIREKSRRPSDFDNVILSFNTLCSSQEINHTLGCKYAWMSRMPIFGDVFWEMRIEE